MKQPLKDVIVLGQAMKQLEEAGLKFTLAGQVLYSVARNRVWEFVDPWAKEVRAEFDKLPKEQQTVQAFNEIHRRMFSELNGDEVDLELPPPIKTENLKEINCSTSQDHECMARLVGKIFAVPE